MAYIAPDSDIYILKGVPLDKDYNHTVLQTSASNQYNMFYAYRKYTFNDQSYQRAGQGKLRIATLADNLYDCNYLMFRNTAFGNKWFYAFLDTPTYINNNVTEVNYTIDVMQTWYFDYDLGSCYVEREHTLTDVIGDNLVPEDVSLANYVVNADWEIKFPECAPIPQGADPHKFPSDALYAVIVYYTPDKNGQIISRVDYNTTSFQFDFTWTNDTQQEYIDAYRGLIIDKMYLGCQFITLPIRTNIYTTSNHDISKLLRELTEHESTIIGIKHIPLICSAYINYTNTFTHAQTNRNYDTTHTNYYIPKNKKMQTYPFRKLIVSNNAGQTAEYQWENFTANNINGYKQSTFTLQTMPLPTAEVMLYPTNYRGIANDYENGLLIDDFPDCGWNVDSFSAWWNQNKEAFIISTVSSAVATLGSIAAAGATGGASIAALEAAGAAQQRINASKTNTSASQISSGIGGVTTIANNIGSLISAKNAPDQFSGQIGAATLRTGQNRIGYHLYDMGLEKDCAEIIDDYFTMFGYAIKQVKVPNVRQSGVTLRPHWNYVKTQACIIHPASGKGLPSDDESKIAQIYNNGITFWNSISEVGNYSLDNSPAS